MYIFNSHNYVEICHQAYIAYRIDKLSTELITYCYTVNCCTCIHNIIAGQDYERIVTTLVFTGESVQSVSIEIIDDEISESLETFHGQLTSADPLPPNIQLNPARATFTIFDDNGIL